MPNIQESTFNTLIDFHSKEKDLVKTIKVCKSMITSPNKQPMISGEIAEVVLYLMLEDFIERNNIKDWRISKGIVLKNLEKGSNYSTELDLTLFTPKCIFSFECKSYTKEKYLEGKGSLYIKRGNKFKLALDVFDQHHKHFKALMKNIGVAQKKDVFHEKYRSYKLLYFDFADVPTEDRRDKKSKSMFPLVNCKNLYKIFNNYSDRPDYWDMNIINKVVDIIEKNGKTHKVNHIKYVSSLHHS